MSDDYTPTTEQVRENFIWGAVDRGYTDDGIEGPAFDRWLAAHDAEVRAEQRGFDPGAEWTRLGMRTSSGVDGAGGAS